MVGEAGGYDRVGATSSEIATRVDRASVRTECSDWVVL